MHSQISNGWMPPARPLHPRGERGRVVQQPQQVDELVAPILPRQRPQRREIDAGLGEGGEPPTSI